MGNDVSLINGCHFYTLEKQPIEAYLDDLLRVRIMLLFGTKIGRQELQSKGFIFGYDKKERKLIWLDERYCFNGGKQRFCILLK
jgi:hypothetical protein